MARNNGILLSVYIYIYIYDDALELYWQKLFSLDVTGGERSHRGSRNGRNPSTTIIMTSSSS